MKTAQNIVGLIPAAGRANRLYPLPCSKELYPLGFLSTSAGLRPKVVCHYLLEKMQHANITKAFIILRDGKWDIPSYFGDGKLLDMQLAYLIMGLPYGVPFTLDQAYPFVNESLVALGFPDMIFYPDDAFVKLLDKQGETGSDLVLGLFPADKPHKTDMVEFNESGSVRSIHIKPDKTQLTYAWEIAVWTPVFTRYLHNFVSNNKINTIEKELFVGDVIQAAIDDNMRIDYVQFKDGSCLDIGTPEDLRKAIQNTNQC